MKISQAMIDLILDVGSAKYRRRPWRLHASSVAACIKRLLVEPHPRNRVALVLTERGWIVYELGKMLRDEKAESRRLASEMYMLKINRHGGAA